VSERRKPKTREELREGKPDVWARIPRAVLYADTAGGPLDGWAIKTYAVLSDEAMFGSNGQPRRKALQLTLEEIAALVGVSRRTASRAIAPLVELGAVARKPKPGGPSTYTVVPVERLELNP